MNEEKFALKSKPTSYRKIANCYRYWFTEAIELKFSFGIILLFFGFFLLLIFKKTFQYNYIESAQPKARNTFSRKTKICFGQKRIVYLAFQISSYRKVWFKRKWANKLNGKIRYERISSDTCHEAHSEIIMRCWMQNVIFSSFYLLKLSLWQHLLSLITHKITYILNCTRHKCNFCFLSTGFFFLFGIDQIMHSTKSQEFYNLKWMVRFCERFISSIFLPFAIETE